MKQVNSAGLFTAIVIVFSVLTTLGECEQINETKESSADFCLNGGIIRYGHCQCKQGFIGDTCDLPAKRLQSKLTTLIGSNYSFFYYQPEEVNYYRLSISICNNKINRKKRQINEGKGLPSHEQIVSSSPLHSYVLFLSTEHPDKPIQFPSIFETKHITPPAHGCTQFTTNYISVRKFNNNFRRLVVGIRKYFEKNQTFMRQFGQKSHLTHNNSLKKKSMEPSSQKRVDQKINETQLDLQEVEVQFVCQKFINSEYTSATILMVTALILFITLLGFVTYVRRRLLTDIPFYSDTQPHTDSSINLQNGLRSIQQMEYLESVMPAIQYQAPDNVQVQNETCSICLCDFEPGQEIRVTPCLHSFHRQCIDGWIQNAMNCPICRRSFSFNLDIKRMYFELMRRILRGQR